ncbi:MAG TPA: PadR family transcriptional regulator [Solirubrobacteraceae bacterium]|nr:PadR family transcriptional regulator [Solirubrobacteraceae bacterium]
MQLRLNPVSYVVLGLLDRLGPSTPYELKQAHAIGIGNFWTVQHAQFYSEPERLAAAGLLTEEREEGGRRRRRYTITDPGRAALRDWLGTPTGELTVELRDPGLLKLHLDAEPGPLAEAQLAAHRAKLAEYEDIAASAAGGDRGPWRTLQAGLAHERVWVSFWEEVARDASARGGASPTEAPPAEPGARSARADARGA